MAITESTSLQYVDTLALQLDRIRAAADAMQTADPEFVEPESLRNLAGQIFEAATDARDALSGLLEKPQQSAA